MKIYEKEHPNLVTMFKHADGSLSLFVFTGPHRWVFRIAK